MTENFFIPVSLLIVLLAIVLLFHNRGGGIKILLHSLFLVVFAVWAVSVSSTIFGGPVWLVAILMTNFSPLYVLSPVFFYLFVRLSLSDAEHLRWKDLIHLIPFMVLLILVMPYLFTSFDFKKELANALMNNPDELSHYGFVLWRIHTYILFARSAIFLFYMVLSLLAIRKFLPRYRLATGELKLQYRFMVRTILIEILVLTFFALLQLAIRISYYIHTDITMSDRWQIIFLFVLSFVYLVIPVYVLLNPRYMYGLTQVPARQSAGELVPATCAENESTAEKAKCTVSIQENEVFNKLSQRILNYFSTEKPYLNPDFSVHDLCIQLNVPRHHVQYCLNKVIGKSFTQLKNEQRVTYAMVLMKNQSSRQLSIEGIGQKSGFISNSNFYSCFREITGMTPSKWMEAPSSSLEEGKKDHSDIHLLLD